MLDVLVMHEIAEPSDVDRLLDLHALANPERLHDAPELRRHLIPLPAVINELEAA